MSFNTVIYQIQSPRNIGMITRSHVAFGGQKIIFVGYLNNYIYDEEAVAYATNLHLKCEILNFLTFADYERWSKSEGLTNCAVEISETAVSLSDYKFEGNYNFILGNEFDGVPKDIIDKCDLNLVIPQYGPAGCLNVAVSAAITFYEYAKSNSQIAMIIDTKFLE